MGRSGWSLAGVLWCLASRDQALVVDDAFHEAWLVAADDEVVRCTEQRQSVLGQLSKCRGCVALRTLSHEYAGGTGLPYPFLVLPRRDCVLDLDLDLAGLAGFLGLVDAARAAESVAVIGVAVASVAVAITGVAAERSVIGTSWNRGSLGVSDGPDDGISAAADVSRCGARRQLLWIELVQGQRTSQRHVAAHRDKIVVGLLRVEAKGRHHVHAHLLVQVARAKAQRDESYGGGDDAHAHLPPGSVTLPLCEHLDVRQRLSQVVPSFAPRGHRGRVAAGHGGEGLRLRYRG